MIKKFFIIFHLLVLFGFFIYYLISSNSLSSSIFKLPFIKRSFLKRYLNSHTYIVNNNLAQYSSYITKYSDKYEIEIYFTINWNKVANASSIENYKCLVKWFDSISSRERIIELNATSSNSYYFGSNKMIRFELKNDQYFSMDRAVLAIIRIDDFDRNLNEATLNQQIDKFINKTILKFRTREISVGRLTRYNFFFVFFGIYIKK